MKKILFTSESVTEGHPDKMCDKIADSILDDLLSQDPSSRVACEVTACTGIITVMGEITSEGYSDIQKIVRTVVSDIGYNNSESGFDSNTCAVVNMIHEQSPDIALGVDNALEAKNGEMTDGYNNGAGDQGIMFGYACSETPEYMPLPISLAHKLAKRLTEVRKNGTLPYLRPDGKTQVTVEYIDGVPSRIDTIVVSSQHSADVDMERLRDDIKKHVILPTVPDGMLDGDTKYFINPTGRFVIGGPTGDSGLTGRKIIVDTYGGYGRHGGGSFSGKDPTKVDRTGAYAARYIAKNVVAAGLADRCEVQLAYAIGVARPVSVLIETFGSAKVSEDLISRKVSDLVDLRPTAIIEKFGLRRPIFAQFAAYGHMGREELDCPWEALDIRDELKTLLRS
ncbi:MAG: methionine adenosyltransferase [Clostridia bacterium]|nr:methionine adenosyltransferase [Clostridia bacterium]